MLIRFTIDGEVVRTGVWSMNDQQVFFYTGMDYVLAPLSEFIPPPTGGQEAFMEMKINDQWVRPLAPAQTKSGQTKSAQTKSAQTKSGQTKSAQTKSGQTKSGQTKSGQTKKSITFEWLPDDWTRKEYTRKTGAYAGQKYWTYTSPENKTYRSKRTAVLAPEYELIVL